MQLVRDFACGACGAPRTTTDDAVFIACEFCGALFEATTQRWFDPTSLGEMFARGHAHAFWASAANERFHALGAALERESSDGPTYRALAYEYHYVYTIVHPDMVPASATATARGRAAWAQRSTVAAAAIRFVPELGALFARINDASRAFGNHRTSADDLVNAARIAMDAATRAYAALAARPEVAAYYPLPATHYARMAVRLSLSIMLGIYEDPAIYDRVATEVFGDRHGTGDECRRCGAPLDETRELEACAHCGAVLERLADDPWVRAKLAMFTAAHLDLHRSGTIDTYAAALGVFSLVRAFELAGASRVAALIARAVPWIPAAELHKAAALSRDQLSAAGRDVLDAALASLEPWTPDPARRPALPAPPASAFDDKAWLAKSRRLFGYTIHGDPVLNAFGIAIADLLAAAPNARPPITAELVLRFFEVVLADIPQPHWLRTIAPLVAGYADTPAGALVRELAQILS